MSYQVLARKYRPQSFEAMVGQEHVVQALTNALTQGRLHHAYLFTGTRGVGKTTVSRILAKSLNCTGADGQGGITASPCGVCPACRDIDAGRFVDYVELDAASNRGVEEISQLLDQAVYKPVVGRFKVYMIDEVHMLSTHAFNAMLKTLEEPPEYLKFVLATTDPQKVPVTVLSRCLQFNLRPMAPAEVQDHLARVLEAEGVAAEPGALRQLARAARGSMRDALSLTDQAIAFGAGQLEEGGVRRMLGSVDRGHVVAIADALVAASGPALVEQADRLRSLGLSASGTLEDLAGLMQNIAIAQVAPNALDAQDPDTAEARRLAAALPADEVQLVYSMALHGRQELALAPDEYAGLVMVLLRMLAFRPGGAALPADGDDAGAGAGTAASASAPGAARAAPAAPLLRPAPAVVRVPAPPVASGGDARTAAPAAQAPTPTPTPIAAPAVARPVPQAAPRDLPAEVLLAQATPAVRVAQATAPVAAPAEPAPPAAARETREAASSYRRGEPPASPSERLRPRPVVHADVEDDGAPPPWLDAPLVDADGVAAEPSIEAQATALPPPPPAVALTPTPLGERWAALVPGLGLSALVRELAMQAECVGADGTLWRLRVERESLRQDGLKARLQAALAQALQQPDARVELEAGVAQDSPALREAAAAQARQRAAEQIVLDNEVARALMAQFKTARIVPGSIKPH
ncbi:MAG: DNA polymerase III subunit gamma/tau [Pelomonas sp.]|nr:DNA polymerase III subunit gamma/tau [Roseateles sp.]